MRRKSREIADEDDLQLDHATSISAEIRCRRRRSSLPKRLRERRAPISLGRIAARLPKTAREKVEGFRAPGETANVAELLKFLIDRTGYIKQLEAEDTPEALLAHRKPARTGERRHGLPRPRRDARPSSSTMPRWSATPTSTIERRADHADDAARRQGPGVSAGLPGGMEEGLFPHSRTLLESRRNRRGAAPLLRRHDARHGHAGPHAGHAIAAATAPTCRRPACRRAFWKRFRRSSSKNWVGPGRASQTPVISRRARPVSRSQPQRAIYPLFLRRRRPERALAVRARRAQPRPTAPARAYNSIDNIAEFFASRGKKFNRAQACRSKSRKASADSVRGRRSGTQIWRRNGLPARGRWGRREDYGTISSLRFEEAGGEVRPAGKGVERAIRQSADTSPCQ